MKSCEAVPVQIDGLAFGYGNKRLFQGASLSLDWNDRVLLQGPNGSGKTTLMRILLGLVSLPKGAGTVSLFGQAVSPSSHLPRLGYVGRVTTPGDLSVLPESLTVAELQRLHEYLIRPELAAWARRLAGDLDLQGFADQRPSSLSAGQEKRVQFWLALSKKPDLLLCDEAFANLDAQCRPVVQHHIEAICREKPMAILWITHDPRDAMGILSSCCRLSGGHITRIAE
jgi:ABC-type multidrug transport system ATPase subunit